MSNTVAERIKELRISEGLSIDSMAKCLGMPREHYRRLEQESRVGYSQEDLSKIANYHHVSTDYLFVRTEEKTDFTQLTDEQLENIKRSIAGSHDSNVTY